MRLLRLLRWTFAALLTVAFAIAAAVVLSAYEELTATLPPIDRLLEYEPPMATRVYAADGSVLEEFFRERRYRTPIADIPPLVRNAFLAAEDADFYAHHGVDFLGIARAFAANLRAGNVVQGGSTITQQVVKALLLTPERSYERKLKEILLALRLEQHLSKEQILELYLNQIYFGDGNYGVGAAARNYFGKSVSELDAAEAALLAGLPAAPSRYSPNRSPEAARARQTYVLRRMLEERFVGAGEYQEALRTNVEVLARHERPGVVRGYYTEAVRLQLEDMFGAEAPYNQGYAVHTTLAPRLQDLADTAVRNGIERIDRALGYRGPVAHLESADAARRIARDSEDPSLVTLDPERIYQAVVTESVPGRIDVALGKRRASIDVSSLGWSSRASSRSLRVGDVVEVRSREAASAKPKLAATGGDDEAAETEPAEKLHLAQTPEIQSAMVVIDVAAGGVAAMTGGYDFAASQFNRAMQAKRQPGSAFKPFVYAAALDHGYTPASILQDSPVEYVDHGKLWQPRNYSRDYRGPIRLRTALEQSRNVVSVKLVDAVGVKTLVDYLDRFHFDAKFGPHLSLALGTSEMTLFDLTSGFTVFANGGVKVEPVLVKRIEDKGGRAFFEDDARRREALSPQTAALMTYILEGVVERGTAKRVKALGRPVAGKTGTTNEQRDAWFVGYTPSLVVGVWVGFDDPTRTMGRMGTGGQVAAPIWLEFMTAALADQPVRDFEVPQGIRCVNIDPDSGRRADEWTLKPTLECFREGTEPGSTERDDGFVLWGHDAFPPSDLEETEILGSVDPEAPPASLPPGEAAGAGAGEPGDGGDRQIRAVPQRADDGRIEIRLFRDPASPPVDSSARAPRQPEHREDRPQARPEESSDRGRPAEPDDPYALRPRDHAPEPSPLAPPPRDPADDETFRFFPNTR